MKQIQENRVAAIDENRMKADPRNLATVKRWDVDLQRIVDVEVNGEERDSFHETTGSPRVTFGPNWPAGVHTVGEIRRQGLVDVNVVCPRDVVVASFRVHVRGDVLSWARAVEFGIVDG